jgi:hypothetical protein
MTVLGCYCTEPHCTRLDVYAQPFYCAKVGWLNIFFIDYYYYAAAGGAKIWVCYVIFKDIVILTIYTVEEIPHKHANYSICY